MIAPAPIQFAFDGRVAIVTLSNPPINTLSIGDGVVDSLSAALMHALSKPEVTAAVVMADGKLFSAGADIADFDKYPDTLKRMRAFTSDTVESAAKPVVIAIHGAALGAGLELAMAGHYRICSADATFGLPEVTLGLLPGGGGTQRLPRLIGPSKALAMMLNGKAVGAVEALQLGLVDRMASDNLRSDAINWAATLDTVRRTCDRPVEGDFVAAIVDGRGKAKKARLSDAPTFIVDCVEAACKKPYAEGMRTEAELFERLRLSESSHGLRHAFYARRRVAHISGLPKHSEELTIQCVAVVGAGTMGTGITLSVLAGGFPVTLIEPDAEARARAAARIKSAIDNDVAKGRLSAEGGARLLGRLSLAEVIDAAAPADLVIEAVFEDMAAKASVFAQLDLVCKSSTIFASNTSTLDLYAIADLTARPERVIGMHFFSPANIMRLRVMDLAGQDIGWSIRKRRAIEQPDRPYSKIPDLVCEQRRFGQKTGSGFYRYPDARTPQIDPQITAMIVEYSVSIGMTRRPIDDEEIVMRCVLAMANEGARIVAEGIAYRPLDVDVIYLDGYGFPAERGGPMFFADRIGLPTVLEKCRQFRRGHQGWAWAAAPLLVQLADTGSCFGALNE